VEGDALMPGEPPASPVAGSRLLVALLPFVVLSAMNAATYRYGVSDQAFYVPAVLLEMHPDYFPSDAPVIEAQARVTMVDETIGRLALWTRASLPALFGSLYLVSLLLFASASWLIASRLYRDSWTAVALLAALTLRHSIAHTGTNTLEGYFHPRQLAFALGALAIALILRRRNWPAIAMIAVATLVHPTTAMWFAIWVAASLAVSEPQWRPWLGAGVVAAGIAGAWALTGGPLAGRLAVMDPEWLATLESKDYLSPLDWPATTWLVNLIYIPIVAAVYHWRRASGSVDRVETGVVFGALSLAVLFAAILPLNAMRVAIAVQLQPARIFWMLDFLATIYAVWAVAEGPAPTPRRAQLVAAIVICASVIRGGYVAFVEFPQRALIQWDIPDDDWGRAMAWARSTETGSGWLADPLHAVRYGTSVRVAAGRDVLVEAIKDTAIGMYDRPTALRTRDRLAAVGDFATLDATRARELGTTYDLDYLIAERDFDLPLAFESGRLRVYRLR
jgi:hypothetical protein